MQVSSVETALKDEEDSDLLAQNSAFSDDGSSIGRGSVYGPPDLGELGFFGEPCCRAPTQVTIKDGPKQAGVCGRPVLDCKRHSGHRLHH
jgi:hypothetical protein